MKTETKHTPMPWNIGDSNPTFIYGPASQHRHAQTITAPDGSINKGETIANAAFIVRAVNTHQEMLEALKHAAKYLVLQGENGTIAHVIKKAIAKAEARP